VDVGAYGRLSIAKLAKDRTEDADLTELALDRQHERIVEYCKARDWNPVRFYSDIDPAYRRPGQRRPPKREDFENGLADIEHGVIKGLVFWKLDRFVRDHGDFERALAVCEAQGAVLASVTEPLDTSTPMGEAIARLLVTFARLESQTIGLRVAAQAEQAAKDGKPWRGGRHLPYGYEEDRVTVDAAEAAVVNEIADRLLAGHSEGAVCRWLNEQGIPAPTGGRWNRGKLQSLMTNPRLAGLRTYRGEVVAEAVWPAILQPATFERLGRLFGQRARPGRPATRWLVSGIIRCGLCDSPLETRGHKAGWRYVCDPQAQRAGRDEPGCGKITIMAEPVDLLVEERVLDRLAGPRLTRVRRQLDTAELRAVAEQREADRQALVEAARERFVTRTLDPRAYLEVKTELERRIADADRRLDQDGSTAVLAGLPRLRADLDRFWADADIEQRREIVRAVVRYVVIRPASRRGAGLDPDRVVIPKDAWKV
jgi:DNA invertase Pin-like site-specific DNA recombinase